MTDTTNQIGPKTPYFDMPPHWRGVQMTHIRLHTIWANLNRRQNG